MVLSKKELALVREHFKLSPRELELVSYIVQGYDSNEVLAKAMGVTVGTVKNQTHVLFVRMRVGSKLCVATSVFAFLRSLQSEKK
jgi:DNA-binding NarL/FixJ family response regulator